MGGEKAVLSADSMAEQKVARSAAYWVEISAECLAPCLVARWALQMVYHWVATKDFQSAAHLVDWSGDWQVALLVLMRVDSTAAH